ncbi:MAG: TerB family tellurite resistance protein [Thermoleophilia bacterium]|nr:TerB family tellurite resistance protein [Thermoleophilia bacterium]
MGTFVQYLLGRPATLRDYDVAALQLRLLVAMAAVDERITTAEVDQVASFIDRVARNGRDHRRLMAALDELLSFPPSLDEVLDEAARRGDVPGLARTLVRELTEVAYADSTIDHREEFLLQLVGAVFQLDSVSLHDALDDEFDVADIHRINQLRRSA